MDESTDLRQPRSNSRIADQAGNSPAKPGIHQRLLVSKTAGFCQTLLKKGFVVENGSYREGFNLTLKQRLSGSLSRFRNCENVNLWLPTEFTALAFIW